MTAPRVLVNVFHPNLAASRANRLIVDELRQLPGATVRDMQRTCPDWKIDVAKEQAPDVGGLGVGTSSLDRSVAVAKVFDTERAPERDARTTALGPSSAIRLAYCKPIIRQPWRRDVQRVR